MTLKNSSPGMSVSVELISLPENLKRRLHILGLTRGTAVTVLRKKRCGTMIVTVRGVRYALGSEIAGGIFVTEAEEND